MAGRATTATVAGGTLERAMLRVFLRFLDALRAAEADARDPGASRDADASVDSVVGRLVPAIETFGRDVGSLLPGAEARFAQQATYAAAAFADERLLSFPWPGRPAWLDRPLELRLFESRSGGEQVFRHIDQLSGQGVGDRILAVLYLSILNLGFSGRYDPIVDTAELSVYRLGLFELLTGRTPMPDQAAERLVDPGSPPQQGEGVQFLPYLRPWLMATALVILAYLVGTHGLWAAHTATLASEVAQVLTDLNI